MDLIQVVFNLMLVNYSYFQREKSPEDLAALLDIWKQLLADVDAELLRAAALQHIASCKFFPTVADLREIALDLIHTGEITADEAWGEVTRAFHHPGCYGIPEWSIPLIAAIVKDMDWQKLCMSECPEADRARFIDAYKARRQRATKDERLLPQVREVAAQLKSPEQLRLKASND